MNQNHNYKFWLLCCWQRKDYSGKSCVEEIDFTYMGPMIKVVRTEANQKQNELAEQVGGHNQIHNGNRKRGQMPLSWCMVSINPRAPYFSRCYCLSGGQRIEISGCSTHPYDTMLNSQDKEITKAAGQVMLDNRWQRPPSSGGGSFFSIIKYFFKWFLHYIASRHIPYAATRAELPLGVTVLTPTLLLCQQAQLNQIGNGPFHGSAGEL